MHYLLFDDPRIRLDLLPFTFTRPVAGIRIGILTIAEKWQRRLNSNVSWLTQPYLQQKFPSDFGADNILINGAVCPTEALVTRVQMLGMGEALVQGDRLLALRTNQAPSFDLLTSSLHKTRSFDEAPLTIVAKSWDIFVENGAQLREDFALVTQQRTSQPITDPHTAVYNASGIFLEEGVVIRAAILNAERGPIYLGKHAQVLEGAVIRGPFAMGEGAIVNVAGRMIGDTTIGPYCKVGGEVSNSVLFGYSNKVHDGFLGNAVLGEWCNLGAGTNNSNMKNNYSNVKLWNYSEGKFADTDRLFCGLLMGDHSKSAISTSFNTGTVVGVAANVFGSHQPAKYVPSFTWGTNERYRLPEALEAIAKAMERRGLTLSKGEQEILTVLYQEMENRSSTFLA